jgi:hypothetical protein
MRTDRQWRPDAAFDPESGQNTPNPLLANDFRYRQQIQGIYQSYQGSFDAWAVLAGLRTEWTTTDALLLSTGSSTQTRYLKFYPSVHIDRILSDESTLSLGAARRVTRPDPSYLNPYIDYQIYERNVEGRMQPWALPLQRPGAAWRRVAQVSATKEPNADR